MTRGAKVSYVFLGDSIAEKIAKGKKVIKGLGDNVGTFGTPDVAVTLLQTRNTNLIDAEDAITNGDISHTAFTFRNNKEKEWNHEYKLEGAYVNRIGNGDEHVINLGGYDSTVIETTPWVKPLVLANIKVSYFDILGGLHVESDFQEHIESYIYFIGTGTFSVVNDQLIMAPGAVLLALKGDTHRKTDMTGIVRRTDLSLWAYGINRAGSGILSAAIPIYLK